MSKLHVICSRDEEKAQAKFNVVVADKPHRVVRRGDFDLIQAVDMESDEAVDTGSPRYCIVFTLD